MGGEVVCMFVKAEESFRQQMRRIASPMPWKLAPIEARSFVTVDN